MPLCDPHQFLKDHKLAAEAGKVSSRDIASDALPSSKLKWAWLLFGSAPGSLAPCPYRACIHDWLLQAAAATAPTIPCPEMTVLAERELQI